MASPTGQKNVRWFQIAMNDAFLTRGVKSIQDLRCVFDCLLERERALERRALDELHHQILGADIIKLADVGMIQGRDLALEHFDRDGAVNARVACFIDLPCRRRPPAPGSRRAPIEFREPKA